MARKKIFSNDQYPYHVRARTVDREKFDLPIETVWKIFSQTLFLMTLTYQIRIHAFVLMSNHFHLLITDPEKKLDFALEGLLKQVNESIRSLGGNSELGFEASAQSTKVKNRLYYEHCYKYVYRNPVEAGICSRVEKYPYSSLRGLLGFDPLPFPAFDNLNLITNPGAQLSWLNSPYPMSEYLDDIRKALKLSEFEFHPNEKSEKASPLAFIRV